MKLFFDVDDMELTRINQGNNRLVAGSRNFLKFNFNFGGIWANLGRIAVFYDESSREYPVKIENCECTVPDQIAEQTRFWLYIVGTNGEQKIRTNRIRIEQEG